MSHDENCDESPIPIRHFPKLRGLFSKFSWWILLLPTALAVSTAIADRNGPWFVLYTRKNTQEIAGPSILVLAFVIACATWWLRGGFAHRWWIVLCGALMCREFHFAGTGQAIYPVLAGLFIYGAYRATSLKPYSDSPVLVTLFLGAFATYFFALTLDRNVWKFLPDFQVWRVNAEESLETLGHLMLLISTLTAEVLTRTGKLPQEAIHISPAPAEPAIANRAA